MENSSVFSNTLYIHLSRKIKIFNLLQLEMKSTQNFLLKNEFWSKYLITINFFQIFIGTGLLLTIDYFIFMYFSPFLRFLPVFSHIFPTHIINLYSTRNGIGSCFQTELYYASGPMMAKKSQVSKMVNALFGICC